MRPRDFFKHAEPIDPCEQVDDFDEIAEEIYNQDEERWMENYYNEKY